MLDFHMHVLPGVDDGSPDTSVSLEMLQQCDQQKVDVVVASSHFYAKMDSPRHFLDRRREAVRQLAEEIRGREDVPRILLGAEVHYFRGIGITEDLAKLCLQGTNLLLLEMPFEEWSDRILREVQDIIRRGIQPVAAHVERYLDIQPKKTMDTFLAMNILVQCNAEFFLNRRTSRKALQMLQNREIQFLGSDAHNTTSRPPNLAQAVNLITDRLGEDALADISNYESLILEKNEA